MALKEDGSPPAGEAKSQIRSKARTITELGSLRTHGCKT